MLATILFMKIMEITKITVGVTLQLLVILILALLNLPPEHDSKPL